MNDDPNDWKGGSDSGEKVRQNRERYRAVNSGDGLTADERRHLRCILFVARGLSWIVGSLARAAWEAGRSAMGKWIATFILGMLTAYWSVVAKFILDMVGK